MITTEFTPVAALLGGGLIRASAVALMATTGRIAGVSGIAARLLPPYGDRELAGRIAFLLGIIVAPLIVALVTAACRCLDRGGDAHVVAAGLLVGFGAVWGNGCTSGHGVCGISRLSLRSLVATAVFMTTAIATVFLVRHIL